MNHYPDAILFDFDGVLVSSHEHHLVAWQRAVADLSGEVLLPTHLSALSGRSPEHIAAALATRFGVDARTLYDEKLRHLMGTIAQIELLDGTRTLLTRLSRQGTPFGIASNSPRELVKSILAHHALEVPVVLGHEDYTRPKPDPQAYLLLGQKLGFESLERCWVVEDSTPGLEAARRSGAGKVVGVTSYKHDHTSLSAHGVHLSVDNPMGIALRLDELSQRA